MDVPHQSTPPDTAIPERWFLLTLSLIAGVEVILLAAWLSS